MTFFRNVNGRPWLDKTTGTGGPVLSFHPTVLHRVIMLLARQLLSQQNSWLCVIRKWSGLVPDCNHKANQAMWIVYGR